MAPAVRWTEGMAEPPYRGVIADEVVSGLEGELLITPEQVDQPWARGMPVGGEIEEGVEEIENEELGAAVNGHGNSVSKLGAWIVGIKMSWLKARANVTAPSATFTSPSTTKRTAWWLANPS